MEDEMIIADSAGHTMIDIEAVRAAERAAAEAPPEEHLEQEDAAA